MPLGTMLALLLMWFGISTPLVFVGAFFGFKAKIADPPTRTNEIPRQATRHAATPHTTHRNTAHRHTTQFGLANPNPNPNPNQASRQRCPCAWAGARCPPTSSCSWRGTS